MRIIYRFPTLNPIHHSGEGQRKHRKHDRGARDCRQSQHFRTFVFHIYHDKRVLQRENGHERVYEADRQKQANESVRRSFSPLEINRRHDNFTRRIRCRRDCGDQRHIDGLFLNGHQGHGDDEAKIQKQKQHRRRDINFCLRAFGLCSLVCVRSCCDDHCTKTDK